MSNGTLQINRTYDAVASSLTSVQAGVGGGTRIQNQSFLYDEVENLHQRQDKGLGLTENVHKHALTQPGSAADGPRYELICLGVRVV